MNIVRDSELWISINSRINYRTFQCVNIFGYKMVLTTENIDFISLIDSIEPSLLKILIFKVHITSSIDFETAYVMPNKNNINTIVNLIDIKESKTYTSLTIEQVKYKATMYSTNLSNAKLNLN